MLWLRGVDAAVLDRTMTERVDVGNVIVDRPSVEESEQARLYGSECALTLHFPKSCHMRLLGCSVELPEPWAGVYDVIGDPLPYDPRLTPGEHDRPVMVSRAAVDLHAAVALARTSARYVRGEALVSEEVVYDGPAQARRSQSDSGNGEERGPDGGDVAVETWLFAIPWGEGFESLRPQACVLYRMVAGERVAFDVESIEDVGGRGAWASVRAVRHG